MKDKEKENRKIALFIACAWTLVMTVAFLQDLGTRLMGIFIVFTIGVLSFAILEKQCQKEDSNQN